MIQPKQLSPVGLVGEVLTRVGASWAPAAAPVGPPGPPGPQGLPGPQGVPGPGTLHTTVRYIAAGAAPGGDGSFSTPYATIGAFLAAIPPTANDPALEGTRWVGIVEAGAYDEDLAVPPSHFIVLLARGNVVLGDGAGQFYASTVPRSITWTLDQSTEPVPEKVRPTLVLGTCDDVEATSTHVAYSAGWLVSGKIVLFSAPTNLGGTTHELGLYSVWVQGTGGIALEVTGTLPLGRTNVQAKRCRFSGTVTQAPQGTWNVCEHCRFEGLVTVLEVGRLDKCNFEGGLTFGIANNNFPPCGFYQTTFTAGTTLTGPASSARFDGTTAYWFRAGGCVLAGGATLVLLDETNVPRVWYVNQAAPAGGTGSLEHPFQTINAGVLASTSGDTVQVAPGTYTETVTLPEFTDFSLVSMGGSAVTTIVAPGGAGVHAVVAAPLAPTITERCELKGFRLVNGNAGGLCLSVDGNGSAVAGIAQCYRTGLLVEDCPMNGVPGTTAIFLRAVSVAKISAGLPVRDAADNAEDCTGDLLVFNCGLLELYGYRIGSSVAATAVELYYDYATAPRPYGGRQGYGLVAGCVVRGGLVVGGHPLLAIDPDCVVLGNVSDAGLTTNAVPAYGPVLLWQGIFGANPLAPTTVVLALPPTTAAARAVVDLSRAQSNASLAVSSLGAGVGPNLVRARNARFEALTPAGATLPGSLSCGADTWLDVRSCYAPQLAMVVAGNGAVDSDQRDGFAVLGPGPTIVPIAPPFPPYVGPAMYAVLYTLAGEGPTPGTTAQGAAAFTASSAAGAAALWTVVRGPGP